MPVKKHYFGTDGVRGVANRHPITPEFALKLGKSAGFYFKQGKNRPRIVIGKDTRLSGYMLESGLMAGICSMGCDILLVGPMPTPAISFLTKALGADAGIVISASHNPFTDNGIKFFGRDGGKLPEEDESELEKILDGPDIEGAPGEEIGRAYRVPDHRERYIDFVISSVRNGFRLDGINLVLDCSNGAAYEVAPAILRALGADVTLIGCEPDGVNINAGCGSTDPRIMMETVIDTGAHAGIALDGDADRVVMSDETGQIVDGDDILFLIGVFMKNNGTLKGNTIVGTIMANVGLEAALKEKGIGLVRAPVGDRYVFGEMIKNGFSLGGEPSGHVIYKDHSSTGDGIVTALRVLEIMAQTGKPLSELTSGWNRYPQVMRNLRISEKKPLEGKWFEDLLESARKELGEESLLSLRYSGTEPFLRVTVSGPTEYVTNSVCDRLCDVLSDRFGWGE